MFSMPIVVMCLFGFISVSAIILGIVCLFKIGFKGPSIPIFMLGIMVGFLVLSEGGFSYRLVEPSQVAIADLIDIIVIQADKYILNVHDIKTKNLLDDYPEKTQIMIHEDLNAFGRVSGSGIVVLKK